MSKEFDNTNTGALFRNDKKNEAIEQGDTDAEKWADYSGSLNVGGRDYWLNGWVKTSKNGRKFFSLSVRPKDGGPQRKPTYSKDDTVARQQSAAEEMGDEIPF